MFEFNNPRRRSRRQTQLTGRRSVAPTEAGERLLARLAPALAEVWSAVGDLRTLKDAVSGRLRVGPIALLVLGGAGALVRWGVMAFDPAPIWLPLLQCLHALSFGATHLGAMAFMLRAAPAEIGATAQGYLAVAQGLAMAAAMGLAGLLYARYGNLAYAAMAVMAASGAASAFAALRLAKPVGEA